jgi:uncharacterized protein (TIGR03790 family)
MKSLWHFRSGLVGLLAASHVCGAAEPGSLAVVVYNKRLPASKEVADHYAAQRRVPDKQVLGLDLTTDEVVSRAEFQTRLQRPLFDYLVTQGLFKLASTPVKAGGAGSVERVTEASIRYLVLCYGIPLKIQRDDSLQEETAAQVPLPMRRNEAAVDSELTWLPISRQKPALTGVLPNPFYGATDLPGLHPTNGLLLVARLDGPTAEIARGLVDKAIEAETHGLWGRAYFDARGLTNSSYILGDQWIGAAANAARAAGFETFLDTKPETLPPEFPLSHVALYAGWYDSDISGPFARPHVEFMPGAFAYHIHSASATTLRSTNQHWVGPLLAKGATASVGDVEEPFLALTLDVGIFLNNFLHRGASLGEAAWSAERGLSWQTTVVGDPLYRPCAQPLDVLHHQLELRLSRRIEWSHLLVVNRNQVLGSPPTELVAYINQIPFTQQSAVLTEKLGDLQAPTNPSGAMTAYEQALQRFPSAQQRVRLLVALAELQAAAGRDRQAADVWLRLLKECPDYPKPQAIYQKLLPLARKLRDQPLTIRCEAELKRLPPL